jgi:formylglycine-generating enzyme required for sulfatase activity
MGGWSDIVEAQYPEPEAGTRMRLGTAKVGVLLCGLGAATHGAGQSPREFTNSIGMKFVWIEPGTFQTGAGKGDNEPAHTVTITEGYWLQTTEVTQRQWKVVMGSNPSQFKGPDLPAENVSWDGGQQFLKKLAAKERDGRYRLPSEAEWECACRAGGQEPDQTANLNDVAWYGSNSGNTTHTVGRKAPNPWGLFDMRGNVWEWVQDGHGADSYSVGGRADPSGPSSGVGRVVRGGSWYSVDSGIFRCAFRTLNEPDYRGFDGRGFRVART